MARFLQCENCPAAQAGPILIMRTVTVVKTIPLSQTGVEVSALAMGSTNFGSKCSEAQSFALLDQYFEAGGTFLDTANNYSHWAPGCQGGEAEMVIGHWLQKRSNRAQIFLATKAGFDSGDVDRGLRAEQIEGECEKSLRRLGVETIDLYYAHKDDPTTPLEETLTAFDRLVKAGKVRFVGASNYLAWRLAEAKAVSDAHSLVSYCCIQQRFTYLRPKPGASFGPQLAANDDLLQYVQAKDMTMLAYTPLLHGAYTRQDRELPEQYQNEDGSVRLRTLQAVANELGATANQVVYAWMLQQTPAILPILGVSTSEQLTENLAGLEITLRADQLQRLNEASA